MVNSIYCDVVVDGWSYLVGEEGEYGRLSLTLLTFLLSLPFFLSVCLSLLVVSLSFSLPVDIARRPPPPLLLLPSPGWCCIDLLPSLGDCQHELVSFTVGIQPVIEKPSGRADYYWNSGRDGPVSYA